MCNVANQGGKWIRQDKRLAIYLRDGLACVYCGTVMEVESFQLTLDHVLSQEMGGGNDEGNLVTACKYCNSAKQSKSVQAFLAYLARKGLNTTDVQRRIRNHTRRSLTKYRAMAKQIIAARCGR